MSISYDVVNLQSIEHEIKWCSIENCPVEDMGQKMVINIGRGKNLPFYCLMCSNFERKEMNIELKIDEAINVLSGQ